VPHARSFHQALGWPLRGEPDEQIAFFANSGSRLALYRLEDIAGEARQTPAPSGSIRMTLAVNVESRELVDRTLEEVERAGGTILAPAQERFWGGYSGYFADPDGHAWEVAFNPFWPIGGDGLPELS
jgi:predicted lactoylglutathione lyase